MAKVMKISTILSVSLTIFFYVCFHNYNDDIFYSLTITFGTTSYHLIMRLIVGYTINYIFKNRMNYNKKWFKVNTLEIKIYNKLNVKKWKDKMPTYNEELFDIKKHSWDEMLMIMCQSEIVHEINIVLSFIPLIGIVWFGEPLAFIITSILSALFDLLFVIMQRFNRNRILKIKLKSKL